MPHHLIRDMHERMNDIPTLFTYYLMKLQPRGWFGKNLWAKKAVEPDCKPGMVKRDRR